MKRQHKILLLIILITLIARLCFAFAIPNFTYDSYFHLRQVEHITETGLPLYQDSLSYGGRELVFLPTFHYLMSFFDLFLPLEIFTLVLSNLLFLSLIPLIYLISKKITQNETASLLAAAITAFIPIFWQTNSFSPAHLFLPLIFLAIYSFMNISQKKYIYLYLFSIFLLSLITYATFLLIIGFLFYLLLSKLEEKKILKARVELTLFSVFLFLWIQFLFFKKILLAEGPSFIWQNIPSQILPQYFSQFGIIQSLILLGFIPLLASIYTIYISLFKEKNKNMFLIFSLAISTILLLILNLIEFKIALMFLGLILTIIFAQFYKLSLQYFKQTRLTKFKKPFLIAIVVLLLLTSVYPSVSFAVNQETPSPEEITAFIWLKQNTPNTVITLTALSEGHLINYLSKRKNFMDTEFSLIKDVETRFDHLNSLFITRYQTQAIELLNQHDIDYIFFSPQAKKEYQINKLAYVDNKCFKLIYSNVVQIYRPLCQIQPTRP